MVWSHIYPVWSSHKGILVQPWKSQGMRSPTVRASHAVVCLTACSAYRIYPCYMQRPWLLAVAVVHWHHRRCSGRSVNVCKVPVALSHKVSCTCRGLHVKLAVFTMCLHVWSCEWWVWLRSRRLQSIGEEHSRYVTCCVRWALPAA